MPAPPGSPDKLPPTRPVCPCQGGSACSVALPPAPDATKLSADPRSESISGLAAALTMDGVAASCSRLTFLGARRAHPFLEADDLLHVLHRLRC
jgi:hypothetical protein